MATIDTLQINIETNAGQSTKSINALAKAVERLTATTPNVEELGFAFAKLVNAIGRVDTGNLKSGLAASNSTLKSLRQNAEKARESLDVIQTGTTTNTTTVTTENAVSQHTNNIRKSAAETKKLTKQTEKSATAFSKLGASIKRIMLYRAIRSVLSSITKAAREGVENIVEWSKQINDPKIINASKVIAKYNNEWLKVKNTIGAIIIPVLEGLFGEFQNITTAIVNAGNVLIEYFTLLNDNNATKFVGINPDYFAKVADEAKKANGQLQKFDELNNLTTNSGTAETNYNDMFMTYDTTRKIDFTWGDIIDKLKTAAEVMTSIWAISQVTKWGDTVASLFEEGGKAGVLGSLAKWAAKGIIVIGLTFAVDWFLKKKTGKGIGGWIEQFINDNLAPKDRRIDFSFKEMWAQITKGMPETIEEWKSDFGYLLSGVWVDLWNYYVAPSINKLGQRMNEVKDGFAKGFNNVFDAIGSVFRGDTKVQRELNSWWDKNVNQPIGAFLLNNPLATLVDWCGKLPEAWKNLVGGLKDKAEPQVETSSISNFAGYVQTAIEKWKELNGLKDIDLKAKLSIETRYDTNASDAKVTAQPQTDAKGNSIPGAKELSEDIKSLTTGISGLNDFKNRLDGRLQTFLDDLATVGSNITKAVQPNGYSPSNLQKGAKMVQAFADGGYPTSGSLFLAGEGNGAELVGTIGGRTAVVNNAEITTAIATACYNAMSQALSENGMNVTLQGDANQMFKVVQRQARQYRQTTGSYAF